MSSHVVVLVLSLCVLLPSTVAFAGELDYLVFEPKADAANGKQIVLISGDEEYRSEETCPMLAKILSRRHGFRCTVLFAIDKEGGFINPNERSNIPRTDALDDADLMIIGTRFRDLPESQLRPILDYLNAAKPIIGFRTATHAFRCDHNYGDFHWNDFGIRIIGENWVAHHGKHKVEGGRAVVEADNADHPMLRSVSDVFTLSDIYTVTNVDSSNATILLRGAVTVSLNPSSDIVEGKKNDPMMPLAWLRDYKSPSGKMGRVFGTTAGASVDFACEDLRRLLVNACYALTGLPVPENADVGTVDPFVPSFYGFHNEEGFYLRRNLRVTDFQLGSSARTIPPAVPHDP
jgi:type 1 glutamine amidotransferase